MIRCILIDDEPLALQQMESYISKIPYIIYFSTSRLNQYKDKVNMYKNTLLRKLLYVPLIIIIVILVLLICGFANAAFLDQAGED